MDFTSAKQAIKDRIDIADVVSAYTTLKPSGNKLKGKSPFTNEKTPSFFVDPDKGLYYCFSSQKGGDIFSFLQEMEGFDFKEAFTQLAEKAGVSITFSKETKNTHEPLLLEHTRAKDMYVKQLNTQVKNILMKRGVSDNTITAWEIGYAPNEWHFFCKENDTVLQQKITAGLCIERDKKVYDRFRDRIMFPFKNLQGETIAFSGRYIGTNKEIAKYINSPETAIFQKSHYLYGLHQAKPAIRKNNFAILVEGPIDVLMVHQAGFPVAVAASGTAITEHHLTQLKKISSRLVLALDGDEAGIKATIRAATMALEIGLETKVIQMISGEDPASIINEKGIESWKKLVTSAVPISTFFFSIIDKQYGTEPQDRVRGVRELMLPILARMKDKMLCDVLIEDITSYCSISKESILASLKDVQITPTTYNKAEEKQKEVRNTDTKDLLSKEIAMLYAYTKHLRITLEENLLEKIKKIESFISLPEVSTEVALLRFQVQFEDEEGEILQHKVADDLQRACDRLLKILFQDELVHTLRKDPDNTEKIQYLQAEFKKIG